MKMLVSLISRCNCNARGIRRAHFGQDLGGNLQFQDRTCGQGRPRFVGKDARRRPLKALQQFSTGKQAMSTADQETI